MNQSNFTSFLKTYKSELIAFLCFCFGTIFISFFHEPWFDEFQAWDIAKDNLYNILFVIPHMEGHPPLWHLVIKLFQNFTNNPELHIKIPNLLFMFCGVALLLFKSPFPKPIKLILPFTYFIFYQYSIISRPYSMLFLVLCIVAILYKSKNEHPFKFIGVLALLSLTSLYGMFLATAITLAWVMEISSDTDAWSFLKSFVKDKRFYAMWILFFVCFAITIEIFPIPDVAGQTALTDLPWMQRFLSFMYCLPSDITTTNIFDYNTYNLTDLMNIWFIFGCFWGCFINILLLKIFDKTKMIYLFFMTYLGFVVFLFLIYIWPHHIGILFTILLFNFWCLLDEEKIIISNKIKIIIAAIMFIHLYWSLSASIHEITVLYSPARELSSFIKRHELEKFKILSWWVYAKVPYDIEFKRIDHAQKLSPVLGHEIYFEDEVENTNIQWVPTIINPYFNKNIFYNFNIFSPDKLYTIHKKNNEEENKKTKEEWGKIGKPDILVGMPAIERIWEDYKIHGNYITIKTIDSGYIWKDKTYTDELPILVHKRLYEKMKDYKYPKSTINILLFGHKKNKKRIYYYNKSSTLLRPVATHPDGYFPIGDFPYLLTYLNKEGNAVRFCS